MPASAVTRLPSWLVGSGVIALAMGVMNLGTYGFTVIAARLLGPREYGALAAVMGLVLIVNVASLGLQATGARRVSAGDHDRDSTVADILTATYKSAIAVGLVCVLSIPVVSVVLRLDSWLIAGMIALTAVPLTVMGGQAGILQGERRWYPLAAIYLAMGLGRILFGTLFMLVERDTLGAMFGVAVGAVVPVLVGFAALRGATLSPLTSAGAQRVVGRSRRVLRELVHNSHALLAFFALSNIDVVVARIMLDEQEAGLYAGGLILAKAVLFLPQFVVVVAFPSMSAVGAKATTMLKALGMVLVMGLCATLGVWLLTDLAVQFIGGAAYQDLENIIWAFAAVGTIWAMTQLLVYDVVARQDTRAVGIVWAGLAVLVALSPFVGSIGFLLMAVVTVESLVLAALLALALRRAGVARGPVAT